jgi:hypothetical protein
MNKATHLSNESAFGQETGRLYGRAGNCKSKAAAGQGKGRAFGVTGPWTKRVNAR